MSRMVILCLVAVAAIVLVVALVIRGRRARAAGDR